ncbi:MAG TPA: ABC transporter ATP-binding protein [Acidimicrobiales bacterium]|jgi:branched-chain amino acid transport system ATP-binding protein|nr:ABC transporter ATP-binding protein [Acidimicrobiales bacterium]
MALLEATGISKRFGGVVALYELSLGVETGEAVGLVGPNGAGKTTLFNCLLGILRPDTGTVTFDGHGLSRMPIYRRARLGIGRTFQRIELFTEMSARDHLLVAERARRGGGALWKDLLNQGAPTTDERVRADAVLSLLGIEDVADLPVEALSLGHGRLVELGRALVTEPRLLLLDEPSSGLDRMESLALARVLGRLSQERDTAILLVEHDLEMVQRVASRLCVLDLGQLIADGPTAAVMGDAKVRRAYLGEAV